MFDVDAAAAHEMAAAAGPAASRPDIAGDFIEVGFVFLIAGRFRNFIMTDSAITARCMEFLKGILAGGVVAGQAINIFFPLEIKFVALPAGADVAMAAGSFIRGCTHKKIIDDMGIKSIKI